MKFQTYPLGIFEGLQTQHAKRSVHSVKQCFSDYTHIFLLAFCSFITISCHLSPTLKPRLAFPLGENSLGENSFVLPRRFRCSLHYFKHLLLCFFSFYFWVPLSTLGFCLWEKTVITLKSCTSSQVCHNSDTHTARRSVTMFILGMRSVIFLLHIPCLFCQLRHKLRYIDNREMQSMETQIHLPLLKETDVRIFQDLPNYILYKANVSVSIVSSVSDVFL